MEVEFVNRVVSGTLEGLLRSVVAESTSSALVLLLWVWRSFSSEVGVVGGEEDREERFSIPVVRRTKNQATAEAKDLDFGDSDDDYGYEDAYGSEDDYDNDDTEYQEYGGSGDNFLGSGGGGNEGKDDEDPEANGGGGNGDDDDNKDKGEDDNKDKDEDEDEDDSGDEDEDGKADEGKGEVQEYSEKMKVKMTIEWEMEMKKRTAP